MRRHRDGKEIWFYNGKKVGKESLQVLLIPKYLLPAVPSADHMVESAGKMYPRSTSHTGNMRQYRITEA
jgi:hypothetical protein